MHEPQFVTSSGTPVWIDGDGPTLVLVHGVLMDHRMWALQVAALAPSYRVCCIDMLGHGRAPNPDGPRSLEDFVQQVDEVIDELECDTRPALGGFSMGGLITQAYAVKHHQKLDGAIILNAVYDRTPEQSTIVRGRFTAMEEKGVEAAVQSANERWFTDEDRLTRPETVDEIINWMREGEFAPKLKAHRVFGTSDGESCRSTRRGELPRAGDDWGWGWWLNASNGRSDCWRPAERRVTRAGRSASHDARA